MAVTLNSVRRALEIGGAIASIAGFLATVILAPGVWDWLYPQPLLILAGVALIVCFGLFLHDRRRVPADDQKRLDEVFSALPREAIRRIEYEDFALAWPADLIHPVRVFINELADVEHEFRTKPIESARRTLFGAGKHLVEVEGINAVMAPDSSRRFVGIAAGELDGALPEERQRYEARHQAIRRAAGDFIGAHDAFVRLAKNRGFDLHALASDPPRQSWTGVPRFDSSPVRAHWPSE